MPRQSKLVLGLLLAAGLVALAFAAKRSSTPPEPTPELSVASAATSSATAAPDAGPPAEAATATAAVTTSAPLEPLFADGVVPELPKNAPSRVNFGVILVQYTGAEGASKDAPTKEAALVKARELLEVAKNDFSEAAKRGDTGSVAKAGAIPLGVLEPAVEYSLFTLSKGAVFEQPIDTPRGYWIIRRY